MLDPRQIKFWFQNKRTQVKIPTYDVDDIRPQHSQLPIRPRLSEASMRRLHKTSCAICKVERSIFKRQ
ncbi:hypothetical protein KP509_26G024100 [Ceratopteris richardii]|uniref:Homeobox domain-containing protein n=1 Tax=Ceratopteris richardii TaxID=49495 RepID=A0A8T2RLA2_CERRI|nr:hypothetical protein KP509_26G024100 [Ceratopteris richardii]